MSSKVWSEITYPFSNFNGCTIEVWEWISYFLPHFVMGVITYPWWDKLKLVHISKRNQEELMISDTKGSPRSWVEWCARKCPRYLTPSALNLFKERRHVFYTFSAVRWRRLWKFLMINRQGYRYRYIVFTIVTCDTVQNKQNYHTSNEYSHHPQVGL